MMVRNEDNINEDNCERWLHQYLAKSHLFLVTEGAAIQCAMWDVLHSNRYYARKENGNSRKDNNCWNVFLLKRKIAAVQVASFQPKGRDFGGEEGAENVNVHNIHTFFSHDIFTDISRIFQGKCHFISIAKLNVECNTNAHVSVEIRRRQ